MTLEIAASPQAQASQNSPLYTTTGYSQTAPVDPLTTATFDPQNAIASMKRDFEALLVAAHARIGHIEDAVSDLLAEHTETAGTVASHGKLFDKLASAAGSIRNAMGI